MLYEHAGQNVCGSVVSFVVTGGRSWSFQTPKLEVLDADSVASFASLDQILYQEYVNGLKFLIYIKKCLRRNLRIY